MSLANRTLAVALALAAVAGCSFGQTLDQAVCPTGGTKLTWQNFGESFFVANCNRCHSVPESQRQGAPTGIEFNTVDQVRERKDRVYVLSAGPNDSMPPGPDDPPRADRDKLGEWLACGAP